MTLSDYRKQRGLSQSQTARELGLANKASISLYESGSLAVPMKLALRIEAWSDGAVRAVDLLPPEDAQLLSQVISRASAPPAG